MNRVVARSHSAVVVLRQVSVYRDGCLLDYTAAARLHAGTPGHHERPRDELRSLFTISEGHRPLNFELRLADGRTSSTLDAVDLRIRATSDADATVDPDPPVMMGLPGDGAVASGNVIEQHQPVWLWPLPPPEPLRIAVSWTRFGIDGVTHEADGAALVAASRSSRPFWEAAT